MVFSVDCKLLWIISHYLYLSKIMFILRYKTCKFCEKCSYAQKLEKWLCYGQFRKTIDWFKWQLVPAKRTRWDLSNDTLLYTGVLLWKKLIFFSQVLYLGRWVTTCDTVLPSRYSDMWSQRKSGEIPAVMKFVATLLSFCMKLFDTYLSYENKTNAVTKNTTRRSPLPANYTYGEVNNKNYYIGWKYVFVWFCCWYISMALTRTRQRP